MTSGETREALTIAMQNDEFRYAMEGHHAIRIHPPRDAGGDGP